MRKGKKLPFLGGNALQSFCGLVCVMCIEVLDKEKSRPMYVKKNPVTPHNFTGFSVYCAVTLSDSEINGIDISGHSHRNTKRFCTVIQNGNIACSVETVIVAQENFST